MQARQSALGWGTKARLVLDVGGGSNSPQVRIFTQAIHQEKKTGAPLKTVQAPSFGQIQFDTARTTLLRLPSSRLGRLVRATTLSQVANKPCLVVSRSSQLLSLCDEFTLSRPPVYFFDRNPDNFCTVVQLYRSREVGLARSAVLLYCSGRSSTWCQAGAALPTSRLTSSTGVLTSSVSNPAALLATSLR